MSIEESTSLKEAIAGFQRNMGAHASPEVLAGLARAAPELESLARSSYGSASPRVGSRAPGFSLPGARGGVVTLAELLARGPAVVAFYRGGWCPFCNLQLRAYQAALPEIQALGATLVAISPQTPDNSLSTAEKAGLAFPVLSDAHNEVARAYGLVFKLSEGLQSLHSMFGSEPPKFNGDDSWELPVPGTFVLDRGGVVRLSFVDPDYTHRLEPAAILASLRGLAS
jgi:peroxiredoxin